MKTLFTVLFSLLTGGILLAQNVHPYDPVTLPARLENMRQGEVTDAVDKGYNVILPIGAMESSDQNKPVGLYSELLQKQLDSLSVKNNSIIAPPIWYAPTAYLVSTPADGNFDMPTNTFIQYIREVIAEFYLIGFKHVQILIINSELGEQSPITKACRFVFSDYYNEYWKEKGIMWYLNAEITNAQKRYSIAFLTSKDNKSVRMRSESAPLRLEEMTPSEIRNAVKQGLPCFIPVGVIEGHGNHNPLGLDAIRLQDPLLMASVKAPAVIAPTIWYGGTAYACEGPKYGTMPITGQTELDYNLGVARGLAAMGFKHVIFSSGHQGVGSQFIGLHLVEQEARRITTEQQGPGWMNRAKKGEKFYPVVEWIYPPAGLYDHAGVNETSWMLYLRPENTKMELIHPGDYAYCWRPGGEANKATIEHGEKMTNDLVDAWVKVIKEKTVTKSK